jgi:hypothetical protein
MLYEGIEYKNTELNSSHKDMDFIIKNKKIYNGNLI